MLDAIIAETLKFRRHRATWLMVWIYPIAIGILFGVQLLRDAGGLPEPHASAATAASWIQQTTLVWSSPLSAGGRFLIAGFAALSFAGEYGWNTWKLIIPARRRWQLLASKLLATTAFIVASLALADLIATAGSLLRPTVGGPALPEGIAFGPLAQAHLHAAGAAMLPTIYTIAFAGLFAVLTMSLLATVIISIALIVLEQLLPVIAILARDYVPALFYYLFEVLPPFHLANLIAWSKGHGIALPLGPGWTLSASWSTSSLIVLLWIVAASVAGMILFSRQDLN